VTDATNPYLAPETSIGPPGEPIKYSRWSLLRWIPAIYCALMAVAGLAGFFVMTGTLSLLFLRHGWRPFEMASENPVQKLTMLLSASLLYGLGGCLGVLATISWIRRRWWLAVAFSLAIFAAIVPGKFLMDHSSKFAIPRKS
jgi:hypothetical protein